MLNQIALLTLIQRQLVDLTQRLMCLLIQKALVADSELMLIQEANVLILKLMCLLRCAYCLLILMHCCDSEGACAC